MSSQLLLNRPLPKPGESIYSLLYRTAIKSGFEHISSLEDKLKNTIFTSNCNYLEEGAVWTNVFKHLTRNSLGRDPFDFSLNKFNNLFFKNTPNIRETNIIYHKYRTKYCPYCLGEDFYHRLHWDITIVNVCNEHKVALIDKCPKCGDDIYLSRLLKDQCKCGKTFTNCVPLPQMNSKILDAQEAIFKLITKELPSLTIKEEDEKSVSANEYFMSSLLLGKALDQLTLEGLGLEVSVNQHMFTFDVVRQKRRDNVEMVNLTTFIHHLIIFPETYLPKVLDKLEGELEAEQISRDVYYKKTKYLKQVGEIGEYGVKAKEIYFNYYKQLKETRIDRQGFPINESRKYISLTEASNVLSVDCNTIRTLRNKNFLRTTIIQRNGKDVEIVEEESVKSFKEYKKDFITLYDTINQLGLSYKSLLEIISFGLIEPVLIMEHENRNHWYFYEKDIETFFESLHNKNYKKRIDDGWISYHNAQSKLRHYGLNSVEFLKMCIEKRFTVSLLSSEISFRGLYILEKQVQDFKISYIEKRIRDKGFKVNELVPLFKKRKPTVYQWVSDGLLKVDYTEKSHNGKQSRFIGEKQVIEYMMYMYNWNEKKVKHYIKGRIPDFL